MPNRVLTILPLFVLGMLHFGSYSQETKFHGEDTLTKVFKPRVKLGMGQLAYFGEVQNAQSGFSPLVQRIAGHIEVTAPVTNYFRLGFYGMFGRISANERTLDRNLNFNTRIRMGGAMLYYTLYPALGRHRRFIEPEIGIGISSFEFLSKTDLFDANGLRYHYWSDGSIMSLAENDPLASTAVPLQRDYTYESDLRALNLDGLGEYREQAWAFPIHLGVNFHIADRVNMSMGATWYLTTTDLLDGFTKEGAGSRAGSKMNDMMLYSHASLSYDLELKSEAPPAPIIPQYGDRQDLLAIVDSSDSDLDGIIDAFDLCAGTSPEAYVDQKGCPLDSDDDGVPDYRDDELLSPPGAIVDEWGLALTDEELALIYKKFVDSTGEYTQYDETHIQIRTSKTRIVLTPKDAPDREGFAQKKYVIIVGKESKEVSGNDLAQYLGYKDFNSVVKGDTVYYTIGNYDGFQEAVQAMMALEEDGVVVQGVGSSRGQDDMFEISDKTVERAQERIVESKVNIADSKMEYDTYYRVQIGAFSKQPDASKIKNVPDMVYVKGKDGLIRYYSGRFESHEQAVKAMADLRTKGFPGAFVTAYKEGRQVTLKDAGVEVTDAYDESDEKKEIEDAGGNTDSQGSTDTQASEDVKVEFQILLAGYEGEVPTDMIDLFLQMGEVYPDKGDDGVTRYYTKKMTTPEEVEAKLRQVKDLGLEDAEAFGLKNGEKVELSEAIELYEGQK